MTEVHVRPAGPDDAGAVLTVQRAAYVSEAQAYGDPFIPPLVESLDRIRAAIIGAEVVLVATLAGRVVGAVRGQVNGDTCLISRLVVAPDVQGRGVGTRLLTGIEAAFAGRVVRYAVFVGHLDPAHQRLWRRLGYAEVGRQRVAAHRTLVQLRKPAVPAGEPAARPVRGPVRGSPDADG